MDREYLRMLTRLAGAEAERRYSGQPNPEGARSDYNAVAEFLCNLADGERYEDELEWLMSCTRTLVAEAWLEIEAVAAALLERGALSFDEVAALCATAMNPPATVESGRV